MIAALIVLFVGGLIITPLLNYADSSMRSISLKQSSIRGMYAAEAGVENVVWSLKSGTELPELPTSLTENMNGLQVTMQTVSNGNYTLVAGEWVTPNSTDHSSELLISSTIVWDAGADAYKYTVTCTWTGDGQCKLTKVGAKLPVGYNYISGSAALFETNLSTGEPSDQLDSDGAHMLSWSFTQITLDPTRTQIFHITGSGPLDNHYGWAEATRNDVGEVGQLIGTLYSITATATNPGSSATAARIVADVMVNGATVKIISWQVSK